VVKQEKNKPTHIEFSDSEESEEKSSEKNSGGASEENTLGNSGNIKGIMEENSVKMVENDDPIVESVIPKNKKRQREDKEENTENK